MALVLDDPKLERLVRKAAALEHVDSAQILSRALNSYLHWRQSHANATDFIDEKAKSSVDTHGGNAFIADKAGQAAPGYSPIADKPRAFAEAMALVKRCAALPVLDERSADEILGYPKQPKRQLNAKGKYAHVATSSDAFAARKAKDPE